MPPLLAVLVACLTVGVQAASGETRSIPRPARSYIVELDDGLDIPSFYAQLATRGISASPRHNLDFELFRGCSFDLRDAAATEVQAAVGYISQLPAVKHIWPNKVSTVSDPAVKDVILAERTAMAFTENTGSMLSIKERQAVEDTWSSHVMAQVDRLRAEGITGKGVRIAVVDSGVDFHHPALGGCFGPGCLISYGYDYINNTTEPSDCVGHGTHVAGIIAAQSNNPYGLTGVAPGVTLGVYRVAGCNSVIDQDLALRAMNQAYQDGSDIISLSAGFGTHWSEDPVSVAMQRIVEQGVICVVAAGNQGAQGLFPELEGSPSSAHGVASVGSVINVVVPQNLTLSSYTLDSASNTTTDSFVWQVGIFPVEPVPWAGTFQLYSVSLNSNATDDACTALPDSTPNLTDYVVLVRLSTVCDYILDQIPNLVNAHAQRIMFYGPDEITRNINGGDVADVVVGDVTQSQGAAWISLLNAGHKVFLQFPAAVDSGTANWTVIFSQNPATGGFVSLTSSWAMPFELDVKPSFTVPGGYILSTYPLALGSYAILSGTSMATPFVSGVYALLIEARKTKDPAVLQRIISSVAKPNIFQNRTGATVPSLAPVAQQGAGLVQAFDAAKVTTLFSIQSIAFNDTDHFISCVGFDITNTGSTAQTYKLGFVNSLTIYTFTDTTTWGREGTFADGVVDASATLSFSSSSLTIAAGGTANVTVTAQYPTNVDAGRLPVYGGFVTLNSTSGENLSIPYLGVAGSMYNTPVINPSEFETYLVDDINDLGAFALPPNTTLVLPVPTSPPDPADPQDDVATPGVLITSVLGTTVVRAIVVPLEVNGTVSTTDILGHNAVDEIPLPYAQLTDGLSLVPVPFNGMTQNGTVVPEGRYEIRLFALRTFGDVNKVGDYQTMGFSFYISYESGSGKRDADLATGVVLNVAKPWKA